MSLKLYEQDWDELPHRFDELAEGNASAARLFHCPDDKQGDYARRYVNWMDTMGGNPPRAKPQKTACSYLYVGEFWNLEFLHRLIEKDPNPGVFACVLHGNLFHEAPPITEYDGPILRLRYDGSVKTIQSRWTRTDLGPNSWSMTRRPGFFTDKE